MKNTVLVTGAASGIGLGIARGMAEEGSRVILTDLNGEAACEQAEQLQQAGLDCIGCALNVMESSSIKNLLNELSDKPVNILVNNAGMQHVSALEAFPEEKWQQLIDIMLVGPAMLSKAFLPGMRQHKFGRIINIGSIHSVVASKYKSAYVAAKHGLLGFSKVMALETADTDITFNTICPAYVKTPLVESQIKAQAENHGMTEQEVINQIMLAPMPKKSFIEFEEIIHSVKFLADKKARNITGQTLVLDGGWTAQ